MEKPYWSALRQKNAPTAQSKSLQNCCQTCDAVWDGNTGVDVQKFGTAEIKTLCWSTGVTMLDKSGTKIPETK